MDLATKPKHIGHSYILKTCARLKELTHFVKENVSMAQQKQKMWYDRHMQVQLFQLEIKSLFYYRPQQTNCMQLSKEPTK